MKYAAEETAEARDMLRKWFPRGSTVPMIVRSVAKSGASRRISIVVPMDGGSYYLQAAGAVGRLLGYTLNTDDLSITVRGGGMDMCFALVDAMSRALYGEPYALNHYTL